MLTHRRLSEQWSCVVLASWVACGVAYGAELGGSGRMPHHIVTAPTDETLGEPKEPGEPKTRELRAAPGIVVILADGTRLEGTPMHIQVSENLELPAQASITAHAADGRMWSATFGLSLSQVRRASVSLQRRPLAEGIGMVGLDDARGGLEDFDAGTLTFMLGNNHVATGRATTTPPGGSAAFSGRYVLTCWVHPQTLGQPMNGEGDGEVRYEDVDFTSPFCKQFSELR
jgi:hypothetical protein